ncbi:MAG: nitroreductase family protein [Deltaproteobacteria bacterium]|nr:nitroreductase family protein [Deltaproteobacteria bacterium]MBW2138207.1 nitroreductase family protein [Deltaproteobacteria bacterium]
MSELIKEINLRRAKRALSDKKIPQETIQRLMTAATYAPSCFNNQSWRFLLLTDDAALKKVHESLSGGNYWVKKAPLVVVTATKPDLDCRLSDRRDYAHPIAGFDPLKVKEAFRIPDEFIVITLVAIGFPGDESALRDKHRELENSARDRKPLEHVLCFNRWAFKSSQN